MELIDNINKTLRDDLAVEIGKNSKVSIAAAYFSMYAFKELKEQLKDIDELRFIFTSPTFVTDKVKKEKREFYIPRLSRERSLYGTEFEVKLRNELTQKAIARECADWIRSKVVFKSNVTNDNMTGFIHVDKKNYMPVNGFTTTDLGCERGNNAYNMVYKTETPMSYLKREWERTNAITYEKRKDRDVLSTSQVYELDKDLASAFLSSNPQPIHRPPQILFQDIRRPLF